jgi:hypothetical protein
VKSAPTTKRYFPTASHIQERQHHDSTRLTLPTIFNDNYTPSLD